MRLEQLEYLVEISKTKSITLAGENLHVAQQGISKALSNLEAELGTVLFNRSKNGIQFTETGEQIVKDAKEVLEKIEVLKNHALPARQQACRTISGTLNVISAQSSFISFMPKVIAAFKYDYPNVRINHTVGTKNDVYDAVINHLADVGFFAENEDNETELTIQDMLEFIQIRKDCPCIVVNKDSSLAKNKTVSLNKIKKENISLYRPELGKQGMLYNRLLTEKTQYNLNYYDDLLFLQQDIIYGNCIGLTSKVASSYSVFTNHKDLVMIPIRDGEKLILGYCYKRNNPPSELMELLIQRVITVLKK